MYITGKDLRKIVRNVLTEGNFSDPIAGNIAYCIVSALSIYLIKIDAANDMAGNINLDFNFSLPSSANISINDAYKDDYSQFDSIYQTEISSRLERLKNSHDNLKNILEKGGKKGSKRKSMIDKFSGKLSASFKRSYGVSRQEYIQGAGLDPDTGNMIISINYPIGFMNLFSGNEKRLRSLKLFQEMVKSIKGTLTHELVHASQPEGSILSDPDKAFNMLQNPVKTVVENNYVNYSNIDASTFPNIAALQDHLKQKILTSPLGTASTLYDRRDLFAGTHQNSEIQAIFAFSKTLAQVYSPEEVDAYLRGYYRDVQNILNADGIDKFSLGFERYRRRIQSEVKSIIAKRSDTLFNLNTSSIAPAFNFSELRNESIEGYMKEYVKIYKDPDPSTLKRFSRKEIKSRTKAEKLLQLIDSNQELLQDERLKGSLDYLRSMIKSGDPIQLKGAKQALRSMGYTVYSDRIFKTPEKKLTLAEYIASNEEMKNDTRFAGDLEVLINMIDENDPLSKESVKNILKGMGYVIPDNVV